MNNRRGESIVTFPCKLIHKSIINGNWELTATFSFYVAKIYGKWFTVVDPKMFNTPFDEIFSNFYEVYAKACWINKIYLKYFWTFGSNFFYPGHIFIKPGMLSEQLPCIFDGNIFECCRPEQNIRFRLPYAKFSYVW